MTRAGLRIGQVAEQAGTNPKALRYYEAIGLVPAPPRGENRYRLYPKEVVGLLRFIKKAQGVGLTLAEIKEIVDLRRLGEPPCVHVRTLLRRKITNLDQRLKDLVALRRKLRHLLARAEAPAKRGKERAVVCPHIEDA